MKSLLLILLVLTISTLNLKAEKLTGQAKIDSLLAELHKAKGDTNEVKLLSKLSFAYYCINPDKGIEYGEKGVKLAKKIGWKKGEAASIIAQGIAIVETADDLYAGDPVCTGTGGKAIGQSGTNPVVGRALDDAASGDYLRVLLTH
jgi:hypothetical protein